METRRALILYRELAGYVMTSLRHLAEHCSTEVDIIAYPVNAEAPFAFEESPGLRILRRSEYPAERIIDLITERNYSVIVCGGWIDADYLKAVQHSKHIPRVLAFDKQWLGSLKDLAVAIRNRVFFKTHFEYAFVPGEEQVRFARKMGFGARQIVTGVYACDIDLFTEVFRKRRSGSSVRKLWYAGRYIPQKGLDTLWEAIVPLLDEASGEWELHCIGTGSDFAQRILHPKIVHHGFVQPDDLRELITDGEVFVLPSLFEPWGVVVHEFATAGYAMVLTDKVGARTAFLEEGRNGYTVPAGDASTLREALSKLMACDRATLQAMGEHSHQLANTITPGTYARAVVSMMKK